MDMSIKVKKLKVSYARAQCKAIQNSNLYVANLPTHLKEMDLQKLFQDYGVIVDCKILKNQYGQSRGVGFVRLDTHNNAIQAIQAMNGYVIDNKYSPLIVKVCKYRYYNLLNSLLWI